MGLVLGGIALLWYTPAMPGNETHTWSGAAVFGFAICVGQLISAWCAAITGSAAPLIFTKCGLDPTTVAGPMETAVQDVLGSSLLLAMSAALLEEFGDYGLACPGGDLAGCVRLCQQQQILPANATAAAADAIAAADHGNSSVALFLVDCLNNCVALEGEGSC